MRRRIFFKGFTLVELIGVVVILGLIALVALPPILNSIRKTKGNISDASQKILYSAAEVYVSENINSYPRVDGSVYCITIGSLVSNNLLPTKVYDAVTGEEIGQDNIVEVSVNQGQYSYNLNNNCVEQSQSFLIQILLAKYSEGATNGLVKDATNENLYYFKGNNDEVNNNYLWYGGHQWRVIEFNTTDNSLLLISQQPLTAIQPSGIGWTSQAMYEASYVNDWLNDYFYNSLDSKIKGNILNNTFNVGIYSNVDEITTEQKVGLLNYDQYVRAGLQGSYLDINDYWWIGNRYDADYIYYVFEGFLHGSSTSDAHGVRPVIKINNIRVTEGEGTFKNSYKTDYKSTSTSNVQVGEYINVPYDGTDGACGSDKLCTFRVVSKDSDSVKVVLNGMLNSKEVYGANTFTANAANNPIYSKMVNFGNNISNNYRYAQNKTFYIGMYEYAPANGISYETIKNKELGLSIGLPVIGEMFSGNDIDLSTSSSKTFVDVNTIENSTISTSYWTLNRADNSGYVTIINSNGDTGKLAGAESSGVRPVIYLKTSLNFTGGYGTAQNPYTLT